LEPSGVCGVAGDIPVDVAALRGVTAVSGLLVADVLVDWQPFNLER
jgi:hypothetical protein